MADSSDTNRERYPGTNRMRPEELTSGGRGDYCCVPGCSNARYNRHKEKTKIGLFRFPTWDPVRMRQWEVAFKPLRRKGGTDNFDPHKKSTIVCEFHFPVDEIITQTFSDQKNLKDKVEEAKSKVSRQKKHRDRRDE